MLLPVQTVRNQRVRRFPQEPVERRPGCCKLRNQRVRRFPQEPACDVLAEIARLKRGSVSGVILLGNPIDAGLGFRGGSRIS